MLAASCLVLAVTKMPPIAGEIAKAVEMTVERERIISQVEGSEKESLRCGPFYE